MALSFSGNDIDIGVARIVLVRVSTTTSLKRFNPNIHKPFMALSLKLPFRFASRASCLMLCACCRSGGVAR